MTKSGKQNLSFFTLLFALFCVFHSETSADEIILQNGDRLTGEVKKMEKNTVIFETEYSEPVKINRDKILKISTSVPVDLHLSGGEVLKGAVKGTDNGRLVVESSEDREETYIAWDRITAINPTPVPRARWKGNINVGAGIQSGNTDRSNASVGAEAVRKTETDRFGLRFLYNYAEEDGEVSARNTYGTAKYDYFFTKKVFGYLSVEMLKDTFKNLNLRSVVGPGAGYQIWDDPDKFLLVEAGLSYFVEDRKDGDDKDWLTGRLAGSFRYHFSETVQAKDDLVVYPSLEQGGEFQLRNEAALIAKLNSYLSLRFSNIYEHDSDPGEDVAKDDWQWIFALQYDFGL
jgi:putative salt-induced outer membrane protein YdiY